MIEALVVACVIGWMKLFFLQMSKGGTIGPFAVYWGLILWYLWALLRPKTT